MDRVDFLLRCGALEDALRAKVSSHGRESFQEVLRKLESTGAIDRHSLRELYSIWNQRNQLQSAIAAEMHDEKVWESLGRLERSIGVAYV